VKQSLKKGGGLLLLACLVAPALFYGGFLVKQYQIKSGIKQQLKQSILVTITVNKNAVVWVEEDEEVTINGKMFDVLSYATTENSITLTGIYDVAEDALHEQLKKIMQQKSKHHPAGLAFLKMCNLTTTEMQMQQSICMSWKYIIVPSKYYIQSLPLACGTVQLQPPQA
jgi:cell division protein YceG involved in septum cleavage